MADGCVHIYAPLLRGVHGGRVATSTRGCSARIHAELVSIAGVFRVFETIPRRSPANLSRRGWMATS